MSFGPNLQDIGTRLKLLSIWSLSMLIDTGFLVFWVVIQFAADDYVITPLRSRISEIGQIFLLLFQIVLAIATFFPIVAYVYMDVSIIVIQAQRKSREERNKGKRYTFDERSPKKR